MQRAVLESDALAARGLVCHLYTPKSLAHLGQLCHVLRPLLESAYGRELHSECLHYESWAVVLQPLDEEAEPVACCTLSFNRGQPSYFATRYEAVQPCLQGRGLGRLLFQSVELCAQHLIVCDDVVAGGVEFGEGCWSLVAYIDVDIEDLVDSWSNFPEDNAQGHGTFLRRCGFESTTYCYGQQYHELAFHREFALAEPASEARPSRGFSE